MEDDGRKEEDHEDDGSKESYKGGSWKIITEWRRITMMPRMDRTFSDMLRLPCVIAQVTGEAHSLNHLRCSSGVLQRCYG